MYTNSILILNLDNEVTPNPRSTDSKEEISHTLNLLASKAILTFHNDSNEELVFQDIQWQRYTEHKKPEGLENIDIETRKAIHFFSHYFKNNNNGSVKHMFLFSFSKDGLNISCRFLNDYGINAFIKLYNMNFILHSWLSVKCDKEYIVADTMDDRRQIITLGCTIDPFVDAIIREDDSLLSEKYLYGLFSIQQSGRGKARRRKRHDQ